MGETLFIERMRHEHFFRAERDRQVEEMKGELWAWLMKHRPDTRTNEVLRALALASEMYTQVRVDGETWAIRRQLRKWGKAAYKFGCWRG